MFALQSTNYDFLIAQPAIVDVCNPTPCGANAECTNNGNQGICTCIPEYFGNPYIGCRPECVVNSECSRVLACINQKCVDPCPRAQCASNAICQVIMHNAVCICPEGFIGDPFTLCTRPVTGKAPQNIRLSKNRFKISHLNNNKS